MGHKVVNQSIAPPPSNQSPVPTLVSEAVSPDLDSLRTTSQHEGLLRWHELTYPSRPWLGGASILIELLLLSGGTLGRAYGACQITVRRARIPRALLKHDLFKVKSITFEETVILEDDDPSDLRFDLEEFVRLNWRLISIASRVGVPLRGDEASIFESFCYSVRSYLNLHTTARR